MSTRTWFTFLALTAVLMWAALSGVLVIRDLEIEPPPAAPDLP